MQSFKNIKVLVNSYLFLLVFILPYSIIALIDKSYKQYFDLFLVLSYIAIAIFLNKKLAKKQYIKIFLFSIVFCFFGILNQFVNRYISFYNIISPFAALLGYIIVLEYKLNRGLFNLLMIGNYIVFYIIYFSKNPLNLLVPETELITDSFTNTSSNLISAILIINLYICDILNFVKFNKKNDKYILCFAVINVILILIQRSRAGIIVSLIFLAVKLFEFNRKVFWFFLAAVIIVIIYYLDLINLYIEAAGGITGDSGYAEDARGKALKLFFLKMTSAKELFFGYGKEIENFQVGGATQALFLNIWNYQGLIFLIILIFLLLARFFTTKGKMIPFTYFIPFLAYSIFEGFFLPNYWDFAIYLLLFYKLNNNKTDINFEHS